MKLTYKTFLLEFKHPFGVSSNTRKETPTIFIQLELNDFKGYGEACLPVYLGETTQEALSFLEKAKMVLEKITAVDDLSKLIVEINLLDKNNNAAKAAIDIALHDLVGKIKKQAVWQLYDLPEVLPRATSLTIGIDKEEVLIQKIKEAEEFSILKIKAGTDNDKDLIQLIRRYTRKPLYVDVNQGWKDKERVLDMMFWLKEQNVILVEQPMPVEMKKEMTWVTERSPIPTIADESVKRLKDLQALNGEFSGVNIKLMKCTGISEALKMIDYCKKNKQLVLLGCMAESSCATSAMAQLMGYADYIDLDAPLLYKNDPFEGVKYKNGYVFLSDRPGIGLEPKKDPEIIWSDNL